MKKICLLGAALMASLASFAQTDVIKDVERELKKGQNADFSAAVNNIQPALTDPSTANTMMPWYLAGKASFGLFDKAVLQEQLGNELNPDQRRAAGKAFLDGYKYYRQAIKNDSLPDEKGKIKPKKAKEMLNYLQGSHNYSRIAANFLMQASDFDDAYDALEIFVSQPKDAFYGKFAPAAVPDSIAGEMLFFQAHNMLASDQTAPDEAKVRKALNKLNDAMQAGYDSADLFRYGILASNRLNDNEMKARFAQAGYDKFGTSDITFIGELINNKLDTEDYPAALNYVNMAIGATTPENASILSQLYGIQGIINQRAGNLAAAMDSYKNALKYNPENADVLGYYAQAILSDVDAKMMADDKLTNENFKDQILEAAQMLEKVYNIDDVKYAHYADSLYRIYYNLGKDYIQQAKYWEALK